MLNSLNLAPAKDNRNSFLATSHLNSGIKDIIINIYGSGLVLAFWKLKAKKKHKKSLLFNNSADKANNNNLKKNWAQTK